MLDMDKIQQEDHDCQIELTGWHMVLCASKAVLCASLAFTVFICGLAPSWRLVQ